MSHLHLDRILTQVSPKDPLSKIIHNITRKFPHFEINDVAVVNTPPYKKRQTLVIGAMYDIDGDEVFGVLGAIDRKGQPYVPQLGISSCSAEYYKKFFSKPFINTGMFMPLLDISPSPEQEGQAGME